MPLVLVPIVGAEPVVPIISISALFTNTGRVAAFRHLVNRRAALLVLASALPTCALGAWGYTKLSGRGALVVIGCMLMASVPLRRLVRRRGFALSARGLALAAFGWGPLAGGTVGAGIILLSLLMATGLEGAAVVATDAVISIVRHFRRGRRADGADHRHCVIDWRLGISRGIRRQSASRAAAAACAHSGSRCCRHRRRRSDDRECDYGLTTAISPLAGARRGWIRHCRRCAARKSSRGHRAG